MPWYINMEDQTLSDTEPDLTGKTKLVIDIPDGTPLTQIQRHLDAIELILGDPLLSIGAFVLEINMNATWYIDLSTGLVTSTEPNLSGRTEVPFPVPNGTTIRDALAQLDALQTITNNPLPTVTLFVIEIAVGGGT